MIYTKYLLTPGVEFGDGKFFSKPSPEDAEEVIRREEEGRIAYALMGFDPEGEMWEVVMVTARPTTITRRVRMMFGLDNLDWDGSVPMEFDRASGITAAEYTTYQGRRARAWGGLMAGCCAAYADNGADWLRFEEVAKRLGVAIKTE